MPSLASIDPELMFAMLKGEPGTRKSTVALSFPGKQRWFSWDRKMSGLLVPARNWKLPADHLDYVDYSDWDSAKKDLETLQSSCPYETIIFDSLTSMADMTLHQTLASKYGQVRGSGKAAGKLVGGIAVNEIEDYNAESAALQELIYLAKDIQAYHAKVGNKKIKIILIAHVVQAEYRNTTTNVTHVSRQIITAGKKVAPKIPAYCTEVWHFNIKTGAAFQGTGSTDYTFLTNHTGDDFARTSLDLPNVITFNDENVWKKYVEPAILKLRG
jgi:hypothetical protein